ncbi:rhodanese-like domain-containing protein [Pseudonocardia nigra]|uniref:rhodanese-like domain-containing protein n=1 Tax=Pseudonocardia nigra TaxID=1921578 RepID=UPI001C5E5D0C|nr:rhodanese-like domain-containing protein [Pseudonocardia nigra]
MPSRTTTGTVEDAAVAALAGDLGNKAMEPVSQKLYQLESEEHRPGGRCPIPPALPHRRREDHPPSRAAQVHPTARQGVAGFHQGLVISLAPRYGLLRGAARLRPLPAGLATGAAMGLIGDELLIPALWFSAPNRPYPLVTHLRGFSAHRAFELAVAAITECAWSCAVADPDPNSSEHEEAPFMNPTPIDYPALRRLLDEGARLVEVLPAEEYTEMHLPGALNIPLKTLDAATTADLDLGRPVIVYCWDAL